MSTVMVSVAEAGRNLSKLVLAAQNGEGVIITKRGVPAAQLLAVSTKAETANGRQASAVLAKRLARRQRWATSAQVEATITDAQDGWER